MSADCSCLWVLGLAPAGATQSASKAQAARDNRILSGILCPDENPAIPAEAQSQTLMGIRFLKTLIQKYWSIGE